MKVKEQVMRWVFAATAAFSIAAVALICVFLFLNGLPFFTKYNLGAFLFGTTWKPANNIFGILPMIVGSLYVTGGALLFGAPVGILAGIYLARFCPVRLRKIIEPMIGLMAGVTNMVLDALFVGVFRWGIAGAAIATGISQTVGGVVPLMYFLFSKSSPLRLRWTKFEVQPLLRSCANGSSELMSNISGSLIGMLYNAQLMRFLGEDGVATYGVLMYVQFIFVAIDIGYSIGCAPIISYHYGARNHPELRNLLTKGLKVMGILGIVMTIAAISLSGTLANIFVGYDATLCELTRHAFHLFSFAFLLAGFNIFLSSFFTALNNGGVSAAISFLRTLVFQAASVILLPMALDVDGLWWAASAAEALAFVVSIGFLLALKGKYHYFDET